jgi:hypothetical protein
MEFLKPFTDVKQVLFSTFYLILSVTESIFELFELEIDEMFKGFTMELEELTVLHKTDNKYDSQLGY